MTPGKDRRIRLRNWFATALGNGLIRLLGMTWKVRREGGQVLDDRLAQGKASVVVFWHGEILPVAWAHRNRGLAALISRHADGEIIARIVEGLGYSTARGSTTRGGVRALLETARMVRDGITVGFTPDGPLGPPHSFAPGALIVAQRTGTPVIALSASATRSWRLRSWDRHLVPKPFATVTIRYSGLEYVRTERTRDVAEEVPRFEAIMRSLQDTGNTT